MYLNEETGRFELQGITSWGFSCGDYYFPGVYARVMGKSKNKLTVGSIIL